MEKFILSSTPIEISEYPNHKEATFLISVLGEYNANGVLIEEAEGEKYHDTIVGYPIVAYLKYDKNGKPEDFGGHELRTKYNKETKKVDYYFATFPIGSVTKSWIEEREVEGYIGTKKCILIKSKLWKSRFPEYFKVFDKLWENGGIDSSWEISSSEVKKTGKGKILKSFEFIGNCLLGTKTQGAVKGAGVLEVASNDETNYELSNAFLSDIKNTQQGKKDMLSLSSSTGNSSIEDDKEDTNDADLFNEKGGNTKLGNEDKLTSSLTENDVYRKVRKAINNSSVEKYYYLAMIYPYEYRAIAYDWNREKESDFVEFSYTVNSDDTVSITGQKDVEMIFKPKASIEGEVAELQAKLEEAEKQIAEAGKLLTDATKEKESLQSQITELIPFKEKVNQLEQAEKERVLAEKKEELKVFALEDELISAEELDTDEKLISIFKELTVDNFEAAQEQIEVIKGRKAIQKFKENREINSKHNKNDTYLDTSEKDESVKPRTDLNNGDSDAILSSAVEIVKGYIARK
ncbi:coiled-coil domain-containing protein [Paenibacillus xylaniclasticus]|uniref:coiled-coil domain-containing protein n=1 Tax=Paenibacillus xylaniclasticus TaxID=588083 RepID=UPI000FDBC8CE|nr:MULTISPECIES: hypothetical protein [Paenibacillus]